MGIYPCKNAKIYGIKWFQINQSSTYTDINIDYMFYNANETELTIEDKQTILNVYNKLDDKYKNDMYIQIYTECWSSINTSNLSIFFCWYPVSKQILEEYLNI